MKNIGNYPGAPGPNDDPRRKEENTPDLPQRERKHEVEAGRAGLMAVALMATSMLFAQSTTTTPSTPTNGRTAKSMSHSTIQEPQTAQPEIGWTMFNDDEATRLNLQGDQLQRLQDVDHRYQDRYTGMGDKPWTNEGYAPLSQQRNDEVRSILTPEQYGQWSSNYSGKTPGTAPHKPAGMTGTTTPPTGQP